MFIISGLNSYKFQLISQNTITMNDRPVIEVVHGEFLGEPNVTSREIWMEYNGWSFSLACVTPVDATPAATIPISEKCIQLAEGFQFK